MRKKDQVIKKDSLGGVQSASTRIAGRYGDWESWNILVLNMFEGRMPDKSPSCNSMRNVRLATTSTGEASQRRAGNQDILVLVAMMMIPGDIVYMYNYIYTYQYIYFVLEFVFSCGLRVPSWDAVEQERYWVACETCATPMKRAPPRDTAKNS